MVPMKSMGLSLLMVIVVLGFFTPGKGCAATYKYTDKDGNVGLADDLGSIPEQYRASAVLISGSAKEGDTEQPVPAVPPLPRPDMQQSWSLPAATPAPQAPAPQTAPHPVLVMGMPFSIRLAISIGVVIAAILVSVLLGKISASHGHDRAINILRVSLSWLVVFFLVAAHAKDVMVLVKSAGRQVQSVSEASAKKGEKAATAIKALDSAIDRAEQQVQEADKAIKEAEQALEK